MRYNELLKLLPRSLSKLFYSIPKWTETKMIEPFPVALQVFKAEKAGVKSEWLKKFYFHRETLSTILLIFFLKKYFLDSQRMVETTLSILNDLGIEEYNIGSMSFSKDSEPVKFIKHFYIELDGIVNDDEMLFEITRKNTASEIVNYYKETYVNADLRL